MLCVIKVIQLSTKYAFFKRWLPKSTGKQIMYRIIYASNTQSTAVWAVNYVILKCNVFHFFSENSNHQTSLEKGPFSPEVAGAILVYKTINWRPWWCTEKILRRFTFFSCKNFLFFSKKLAQLLTTWLITIYKLLTCSFSLINVPVIRESFKACKHANGEFFGVQTWPCFLKACG